MLFYNNLNEINPNKNTVVTLGKFDGMHRGHQKLFKKVSELSAEKDLASVLFTFDISPRASLGGSDCNLIVTGREKALLASSFGFDIMIECPFTEEIRNMDAEYFVSEVLCGTLKAKAAVVGSDFRFGKDRAGSAKLLLDGRDKFGMDAYVLEKEKDKARDISSTRIREDLAAGNIEKVNELLGYDYFILGEVRGGMRIGRNLGFPTINIVPDKNKLMPAKGVYDSAAKIRGKTYESLTNIGIKPTFGGSGLTIETFILNFNGDLYGETAEISLLKYRRREIKFDSVEALKEQVMTDIREREAGL